MSNKIARAAALFTAAILSGLACGSAAAQSFSAWSTPVNMGPSLNTDADEWHCALSGDGLSIFFVSDRPGGFGGFDLWVAQRPHRNADWAAARNLGPNLNTSTDEFTPELSPDGHWLFFSSTGLSPNKHLQIYAAFRADPNDNLGWGPPVDLGPGVNSSHYTGDPSIFIDPGSGAVTLLFVRLDRNNDDWNIYQSVQGPDGVFGDAVPVPELNTRSRETHPTVRRDGLEVIFVSNRPGSLGGVDLWASTRPTTSDKWSTPVNLGPTVNTEFNDRAPYLSADGLSLVLVSDRPGGFGGNDLYVSTRKKTP
jgi:Tol biopolymer transport system component